VASRGFLAGLPFPPWRKTTQFRLTIRACSFAKLSIRSPRCCTQLCRTATSISLIGHGSFSPVGCWRNCWDGGGLPLFMSKCLWRRCESSFAKGGPLQETQRVRRADGVYRWTLHLKVPLFDGGENLFKWNVRALTSMTGREQMNRS
jgi:hypothetical protein